MKKLILSLMLVMIMCSTSYASNNVQIINDMARLIKYTQSGNGTGALGTLSQVTGSSNISNLLSIVKLGTSVNNSVEISGVNLDNVAATYGTVSEILKIFNNFK